MVEIEAGDIKKFSLDQFLGILDWAGLDTDVLPDTYRENRKRIEAGTEIKEGIEFLETDLRLSSNQKNILLHLSGFYVYQDSDSENESKATFKYTGRIKSRKLGISSGVDLGTS